MEIVIGLTVLVFSAILHEVMHGFVADKLGDPTARIMGRLTLNPIPHIDPLSSIIIPLTLLVFNSPILFGAAKPVPVNPLYLKDGKKDLALVALAGPLTNIALAMVGALIYKLPSLPLIAYEFATALVLYNLVLAIVNLLPIPPLDGSKVITILLPDHIAREYLSIERYGLFLLFFLFMMPGPFSVGTLIYTLVGFAVKLLGI